MALRSICTNDTEEDFADVIITKNPKLTFFAKVLSFTTDQQPDSVWKASCEASGTF